MYWNKKDNSIIEHYSNPFNPETSYDAPVLNSAQVKAVQMVIEEFCRRCRMDLIEHKRLILKNSKVDWIVYYTEFVDPLNDGIIIYRKPDGNYFTDSGYTTFNLDCFVPSWREDGTVNKICKRYGCKMKGERKELQAPHDSQLIQAILTIYAWIEFKGD